MLSYKRRTGWGEWSRMPLVLSGPCSLVLLCFRMSYSPGWVEVWAQATVGNPWLLLQRRWAAVLGLTHSERLCCVYIALYILSLLLLFIYLGLFFSFFHCSVKLFLSQTPRVLPLVSWFSRLSHQSKRHVASAAGWGWGAGARLQQAFRATLGNSTPRHSGTRAVAHWATRKQAWQQEENGREGRACLKAGHVLE